MLISVFVRQETKPQSAAWLSQKKQKAQKLRMHKSWVKTMLTAFFMIKVLLQICARKTGSKLYIL
jgi:hypothetical protein